MRFLRAEFSQKVKFLGLMIATVSMLAACTPQVIGKLGESDNAVEDSPLGDAILPGAPTRLDVLIEPASAQTAGLSVSNSLVVRVIDDHSITLTTDDTPIVSLALFSDPECTLPAGYTPSGSPALTGTLDQAARSGIAVFTDLRLNLAGTFYLGVSSPGLVEACSRGIEVSPGAPASMIFNDQPSSTQAGSVMDRAPSVVFYDFYQNPIENLSGAVTLSVDHNPSSISWTGPTRVLFSDGVAKFPDFSMESPGQGFTLRVGLEGTNLVVESDPFEITAAPASLRLIFSTVPSTVEIGVKIVPGLIVKAIDQTDTLVLADGNVQVALYNDANCTQLVDSQMISGDIVYPMGAGYSILDKLTLNLEGTVYLGIASVNMIKACSPPIHVLGNN
ncbi:MAG: hypothetical protein EBX52_03700 [Proteobacteria bacterium]|nr:hypothetical protein [Pseudomonadota bacterium]